MTMGLEWDERGPYTSVANSEIAMEHAPDRHRFALDRPIVGEPGKTWIYSGGAVALVGALIANGAGKTLAGNSRARRCSSRSASPLSNGPRDAMAPPPPHPAAALARVTCCGSGRLVLARGEWDRPPHRLHRLARRLVHAGGADR